MGVGKAMELFASPVCLSPSEGGAVQQMCRADLPCWGWVFLPTQDVARLVSPPHVRTGSEPAGLLEGQGAEVGGPFWSQSLEARLANVAVVARLKELSLGVLPTARKDMPCFMVPFYRRGN